MTKIKNAEIFSSGGGIYTAVAQIGSSEWFVGDCNEWGSVFRTRDSAINSIPCCPYFMRYVIRREEQLDIWRGIYNFILTNGNDNERKLVSMLLQSLDEDIREF